MPATTKEIANHMINDVPAFEKKYPDFLKMMFPSYHRDILDLYYEKSITRAVRDLLIEYFYIVSVAKTTATTKEPFLTEEMVQRLLELDNELEKHSNK